MILTSKIFILLISLTLSPMGICANSRVPKGTQLKRQQRSFDHLSPQEHFELWTETNLDILFPPQLEYFQPYVSPDRNYANSIETNSIESYDPHLITGPEAKRIANYLFSRELFFGHIPHDKLLYNNQKLRKQQGLSENYIRSIRFNSPFPIRYK